MGPGESIQKFAYLPKAHTDMIYAILGEEFGLVGAGLIIILFGVFALACWQLARRCTDPMGKYLIAGCGMLVTLQAVINIGGVNGALPLTGVPLPFISYGRNSLRGHADGRWIDLGGRQARTRSAGAVLQHEV